MSLTSTNLFWEAEGEGPPIIFAHGFSFDARMWQPQVDALATTHRTIRYDLRGFGRSSLPQGRYNHAEDLQSLITELELERPLLVGLSLGGNVLLEHSIRFPGVARGQVLISAGLPGHTWTTERPPDAIRALARKRGLGEARGAWLKHQIFHSLFERNAQGFQLLDEMVNDYHGLHWLSDNLGPEVGNVAAQLGRIRVQTLILYGGLDAEGYQVIARRLAKDIAQSCLLEFELAGHLLTLEEPERATQAIQSFDRDLLDKLTPLGS